MRMVFVELSKFKKFDIESLVDIRDAWCYLLRWFEDMGVSEKELFSSRSKEMGEIMGWTRPLTVEEQYQVLADAVEKNRRDRVARDDYVFDQGMRQVALKMLKEKADKDFISKVTGLSIDEIEKLENGS